MRDGLAQNPYRNLIQQADGQRRISQLAHHADEDTRLRSRVILAIHWNILFDIDNYTDVGSDGTDSNDSSGDETLSEDSIQ